MAGASSMSPGGDGADALHEILEDEDPFAKANASARKLRLTACDG